MLSRKQINEIKGKDIPCLNIIKLKGILNERMVIL